MGTSRAIATVLAAALLATPTVAFAQPAPAPAPSTPPTAAQKQQAGDLVKRAIAKSQAGEQQAAIDLYLQAYAILPEPVLLSNVGAAYQTANKPVEALKYFCKYLELDPTGTNASYALAQAKQIQPGIGNNGDNQDPCAKPKPVEHVTPPVPVDKPQPPTQDPAGMSSAASQDDDSGHTIRIAGLVIGGLGVVGLALGFYYGHRAQYYSDQITNHDPTLPWPSTIQQTQADGKSAQNKQIGFLIAGGALALAGGAMFVMFRGKHASESVSIAPAATTSSLGFVVGGGF